jgi:hypothetical protein
MEEEYQAPESRIPRWALIAGVVLVFLCLAVLVSLFLARTRLLSVAVSVLASETSTPTETLLPTETFTPAPTDTEAPTTAPSATPSATPLPMPPVDVAGLSQGAPVFTDAFADNSNGWQGINQTSEVIIQEAQLQLRSADTGKPAVAYCQGETCGPYQDYYYVQAEMVEDRVSTLSLGLIFGLNQQKSGFYNFAIRPSSAEISLQKVANGQWTTLIEWTPSPAVKFFPFVNTLGVSYLDGNIQLYANGVQVGSYKDPQPYKSGRIGFAVESDGVRLLASNVMVMNLAPVTPTPPSAPAAGTQAPIYQSPTPASRITPSPTAQGSCPSYVPAGNFVLIVFKTGTGRGDIEINGSNVKVDQGNNVFYLPLEETHIVNIKNRSYELYYETCKIVTLKLNE